MSDGIIINGSLGEINRKVGRVRIVNRGEEDPKSTLAAYPNTPDLPRKQDGKTGPHNAFQPSVAEEEQSHRNHTQPDGEW
jgi:hypothetical protein